MKLKKSCFVRTSHGRLNIEAGIFKQRGSRMPVPSILESGLNVHQLIMSMENIQFLACTNTFLKLSIVFSCFEEKLRIWKIETTDNVQEIKGIHAYKWS